MKEKMNSKVNETEQKLEQQLAMIKKGAAQLIGEEELRGKIQKFLHGGKPLTVKFGMDPSAPDLHLGHAVVLRKLRQLQDMGHHIVILIGDFTAKIGDPTGKSKGRRALTDREVMQNAMTYQEQVFHILDKEKTEVRFNGEWLELLQLQEVLQMASQVTVARMLERDDFEKRFHNNTPIGLHEFFYPVMQAYDSVAIEADLELGGTDQTYNVLMGRDLQRDFGQSPQAALFMPILEGLDGVEKMSKSLGNYIGIYEEAVSMFQKVMQVPDELILRYFDLATDITPEEISKFRQKLEEGCNPKEIKLILAEIITGLYHTEEETQAAKAFFEKAFTKKEIPEEIEELCCLQEEDAPSSCPEGTNTLLSCMQAFVDAAWIVSKSEFRRLLSQGGVTLNGERLTEVTTVLRDGDVLKLGKRKFVRLRRK